eukprot:CAMPEP_0180135816 /NCGR_PEP_ID=MMETSP0986-20121125/11077_1 /TAXON_ID=697907 /ORGANISM="non described non described, Strain CCMP2293" /LENGTH=43 /DNA_ID= /DNA_START= /DNA_END= /DNA_ORIENTATION=
MAASCADAWSPPRALAGGGAAAAPIAASYPSPSRRAPVEERGG